MNISEEQKTISFIIERAIFLKEQTKFFPRITIFSDFIQALENMAEGGTGNFDGYQLENLRKKYYEGVTNNVFLAALDELVSQGIINSYSLK